MAVDNVGPEVGYFFFQHSGQGNAHGEITAVEILDRRLPQYALFILIFWLMVKRGGHHQDIMAHCPQILGKDGNRPGNTADMRQIGISEHADIHCFLQFLLCRLKPAAIFWSRDPVRPVSRNFDHDLRQFGVIPVCLEADFCAVVGLDGHRDLPERGQCGAE
jgi:hypothetical protein